MHHSDFLIAVRAAMPSRHELELRGLEPDEIEGVQATFRSVPREEAAAGLGPVESELERMVLEKDCSTLEIGLIRFLDGPREHRHGVQVAVCEADAVVVSPSGSVALHDHADPNRAMACAADSERFLDALGAFLAVRADRVKWKGRVNEAADLCAEKAGGPSHVPFYRLLCSFLAGGST